MISPFNSPVEVGVRVLAVLVESYPRALDLGQLVMLDHLVLNTADVDGAREPAPAAADAHRAVDDQAEVR